MARKIETYISTIAREGEKGSIRGKIPAGLIKAINAKEGDGVEFQVHGTTLVGAQVLSGKALRDALKEKGRTASTSTKKSKTSSKVKKVKRSRDEEEAPVKRGKKAKPSKKTSKRRTEVEYEAPVKRGKKAKKFKLGKKKK